MAHKELFTSNEFLNLIKSIEDDDDISRIFQSRCLGRVDDLFDANPYGGRAWVWLGTYNDKPIIVVTLDEGNGYASISDWFYPTQSEIIELIKRSEENK